MIPQGKTHICTVVGFVLVVFGFFFFLVCFFDLFSFFFFFFGYGMSIESLVIVERQPDNQPKATVSNTDCLSHVFPVLLF